MLWAVGLRGAVAYGLIVNMPRTDKPGEVGIPSIETAALLIVVTSTLVLGSATGPLLRYLDLEGSTDDEIYASGWAEEGAPGQPPPPPGLLARSAFHERFKELDETMLKPLFGGRLGDIDDINGGGSGRIGLDEEEFAGESPALRLPLFGNDREGPQLHSGQQHQQRQQRQYDYFSNDTGTTTSAPPQKPQVGGQRRPGSGGTPIPTAHALGAAWGSADVPSSGAGGGGSGGVPQASALVVDSPKESIVQMEAEGGRGPQQGQQGRQGPSNASASVPDAIQFGDEDIL